MKKFLYKIIKPHKKLKVNLVDILLLIEPIVMETDFFILGRIFLSLALFLNYFGYYLCDDMLIKEEKMILKSTMVIIALLLIYLIITGY